LLPADDSIGYVKIPSENLWSQGNRGAITDHNSPCPHTLVACGIAHGGEQSAADELAVDYREAGIYHCLDQVSIRADCSGTVLASLASRVEHHALAAGTAVAQAMLATLKQTRKRLLDCKNVPVASS
jgi:hypothetical protein